MKAIIILDNLEVKNSNGYTLGYIKWDALRKKYRFNQTIMYDIGFSKEDLKLIAKKMEKLK